MLQRSLTWLQQCRELSHLLSFWAVQAWDSHCHHFPWLSVRTNLVEMDLLTMLHLVIKSLSRFKTTKSQHFHIADVAWGHSSKCLLKHCLLGKNYPLIRANKIGVLILLSLPGRTSWVFSAQAEQSGSGAPEQAFLHQCFPAQTPALPGEGWSGIYPSDTHRCPSSLPSCCMLAWLARATPMAGGQGASHQRGQLHGPRAHCQARAMVLGSALQDWAFLWINQKYGIFCLALNAKGWGWLCRLFGNQQSSYIFYFYWCFGFNFCKLLRSFAKPVCAFSSHWPVLW